MFTEDLDRPGLAGMWAETADVGADSRSLADVSGAPPTVEVSPGGPGPRCAQARATLHAFREACDADRSVAAIAS